MATAPIDRAPGAAVIYPDRFPPAAAARLAGKLLNRHSPHEIAEVVTILIDVLDLIGGDAEAEPATWPEDLRAMDRECLPDDSEAIGDELDMSWPNKIVQRSGMGGAEGTEDDEPDDFREMDDGE